MIIEIQHLKEGASFRIDLSEEAIQNVVASAFDDNAAKVSGTMIMNMYFTEGAYETQ